MVGADGLHSNVRRLVFGDEAGLTRFIGGYLAVQSVPKALARDGEMVVHVGAGRLAGIYTAQPSGRRARIVHVPQQGRTRVSPPRCLAAEGITAGRVCRNGSQVDSWLDELDRTPTFYFDSITQLQLDTWSRGRVTLVGDAGYCPGPAVGGSTSLAVLGAYVLAGELAQARGDHARAFAAYEQEMADPVRRSRAFARGAAKAIIPGSTAAVWALTRGAQLISLLPAGLTKAVAKMNTKGVRLLRLDAGQGVHDADGRLALACRPGPIETAGEEFLARPHTAALSIASSRRPVTFRCCWNACRSTGFHPALEALISGCEGIP